MSAFKRLFISLFFLPLLSSASPAVAYAGADWGWISLVVIFLAMVLIALFALSKAIDSLADRIREKRIDS